MAKRHKRFGEQADPADKKKVTTEGLRKTLRIFRFVLPYKRLFGIGLLFLALSQTTTMLFPGFIGEILAVIERTSKYTLNQVIGGLLLVLVCQAVFSFFRIYFFTRVSERSMADVRRSLYTRLVHLPISFFEQRRVGELMSRIGSDVTQLQDVLSITLAEFFRQITSLVVGIVIISFISWKLTLFMLATFPVLVVAAMGFGRYIRKLSKQAQDNLANANVVVEETLQSVQVVKAFTNEKLEVSRYGKALDEVVQTGLRAATFRGGFVSFLIFGLFGGIVAVVWYGATLVLNGEMQLSQLMTFVFYTMFIGGSVGGLGDIYTQLQKTIGASERVVEMMEETPEMQPDAAEAPTARLAGAIEYHNVHFRYPARPDVEVLQGISLSIQPGEKVALVGYSGAGKSTLVQLLMRFYAPASGEIRADGRPIQDYPLTAYRSNMAVVPQEVLLFGGTIAENIGYGRPGATEAEIREAARQANALSFIETFPDGFRTLVGERGIKLSGGQRQRIAIARAILKDPAILILDEATSSLDAESERLVQEALDTLMQGRTTLIIAHRLATIRYVDRIYVLQQGRIAEEGSHEELSARPGGIYRELVKLQFESAMTLE